MTDCIDNFGLMLKVNEWEIDDWIYLDFIVYLYFTKDIPNFVFAVIDFLDKYLFPTTL